ncbi:gamma carbonic anhydrase family protein [Acinetobacter baylyi]|uniref:gamma carbonic anhydrase family protein n=1 Tax=Acinetobacter baylyi TaxID=202950 RepID=UPI000EA09009|nr:gamma carbonic anhydrase family protein [Acinetobacter baylyi]
MMYKFQGYHPKTKTHPWNGWIAGNATVIGHVELGDEVSIWFGAVIRGDNSLIRLGDYTNVQENAVLHTDAGIELHIGNYVTVGHQAMLHGCHIGDNTLIGINAVILNHAVIGKNCIIGANALIPEGKVIPDNSVVMGSPGKIVKTLDEEGAAKLRLSALHYAEHYKKYIQLEPYFFDEYE